MTDVVAQPQDEITMEEAVETLGAAVEQLLAVIGQQHNPAHAASLIFIPVVATLDKWMSVQSIRPALLSAFVSTHSQGMNFTDIKHAKDALAIINDRQKAGRGQRPTLIVTDGNA